MELSPTFLDILSATYGTKIVTDQVRHLYASSIQHSYNFSNSRVFSLIPNDILFGTDLSHHYPKVFVITWRVVTSNGIMDQRQLGSQPRTSVAYQDYPLDLPYHDLGDSSPHQPLFAISADFYLVNATFFTHNVTTHIAERIFWSKGEDIEIPVSTFSPLLNATPSEQFRKSLTITCTRRGQDGRYANECYTALEGEKITLSIEPKSPRNTETPSTSKPGSPSSSSRSPKTRKRLLVY